MAFKLRSEIYREVDVWPLRRRDILLEEPYRSALRRFYIACDAYYESPRPIIKFNELVDICLSGPAGAKYLKRVKTKAFWNYSRLDPLEKPEWFDEVPTYSIRDIGDIFNYSYLILWKEDDPMDYQFGHIPVQIKPDALKEFKSALWEILPEREDFEKVDDLSILTEQSASSAYFDDLGVRGHHWEYKRLYLTFATSPRAYKRSIIRVGPANTRDAHIVPPDILNSIKWVDKQIHRIIKDIPGNAMIDNVEESYKKIYGFRRKFPNFLCRDIKKEGITKPRELIKAAQEVLTESYPDLPWERMGIYDKYSLIFEDGHEEDFERGHGLGLANSLTTLIQIAVIQTILNRMEGPLLEESKYDYLVYNDDFVAGFEEEEILLEYWDREGEVFEDLSLIRHPNKSFRGEDFVFLEIYHPFLNDKESYLRRELLMPLCANSIVQAKGMIASLLAGINLSLSGIYLDEIIDYWGYEFDPTEVSLPYSLGGWKPNSFQGVDLTFMMVEPAHNLERFWISAKENRIFLTSRFPKSYKSAIEEYLHLDLQEDPYREILGAYRGREASRLFSRPSLNPEDSFRAWKALESRRKKRWANTEKYSLFTDFYNRYVDENFSLDVPCKGEGIDLKDLIPSPFPRGLWEECFRSESPIQDYLQWKYPKEVFFKKSLINPLGILGRKSSSETWSSKRLLFEDWGITPLRFRSEFSLGEEFSKVCYELPKEFYETYINPHEVCDVFFYSGILTIPLPKYIGKRKDIINFRDEITHHERCESNLGWNLDPKLKWRLMSIAERNNVALEDVIEIASSVRQDLIEEAIVRKEPEPEIKPQDTGSLENFDGFWISINTEVNPYTPGSLYDRVFQWYFSESKKNLLGFNWAGSKMPLEGPMEIRLALNLGINLESDGLNWTLKDTPYQEVLSETSDGEDGGGLDWGLFDPP